jgi:hypothetical protein
VRTPNKANLFSITSLKVNYFIRHSEVYLKNVNEKLSPQYAFVLLTSDGFQVTLRTS